MEYPKYSFYSRVIQMILIVFICLSVFLLFTETLTSFHNYSESTELCGKVLEIYCRQAVKCIRKIPCHNHVTVVEREIALDALRKALVKVTRFGLGSDPNPT